MVALAERVEALWGPAVARLQLAERDLRRDLGVWPEPWRAGAGARGTPEAVRAAMQDPESALGRLRLAMDAWCALWFWPLDVAEQAPSREAWLAMLEDLLGIEAGRGELHGQLDFGASLEELAAHEQQLAVSVRMRPVDEVLAAHPWLRRARQTAEREGFFHWELEFGHVFGRGGFDLQVGNPPWVRLDWKDDLVLAEIDPWFAIEKATPKAFAARRAETLAAPTARAAYLDEVASASGLVELLGAETLRPDLAGIRTNLYALFMDATWRHMASDGVVGLLHPGSHFNDPNAQSLRRATYPRLRRYWHFVNEAKLFEDIGNRNDFGVHVYGSPHDACFLLLANAHLPETVDGSLLHDGQGDVPGIMTADGRWDRRPHIDRVLRVDLEVLRDWALLFDGPGTAPLEARLALPHTRRDLEALAALAAVESRLEDRRYHWTSGWNETTAVEDGIIRRESVVPHSWDEAVLQGPHFAVSNPFAKQPNENCRNHRDYAAWDLESLADQVIPRTNYQRTCPRDRYDAAAPQWNGRPAADSFRAIHRSLIGTGGVRSVQAALVPPGPLHVHASHTIAIDSDRQTALLVGLWSCLPIDYLVKVSGHGHIQDDLARRLPFPSDTPFDSQLLLRTLRLNCLTRDYAPLWDSLYEPGFAADAFASDDARLPALGAPGREWTMATPLRRDLHRRQALVEIDALGALMLGLTADQLCAIYRTQFAVLRKYEHVMRFDQEGRQVPADVVRAYEEDPRTELLGRYVPPFTRPDREAEMRRAYATFEARVGASAR